MTKTDLGSWGSEYRYSKLSIENMAYLGTDCRNKSKSRMLSIYRVWQISDAILVHIV
jgi:hypothetical protein